MRRVATRKVEYLLIGGGLASANCARWLREGGAQGTVLVVGREPDMPYNRPECTKGYLRGEETREQTMFRPQGWWGEQDIEVLTRTSVTGLDLDAKEAKLSSKDEVEFGQALIATGANVRRLNVEGCELHGIYYLRTLGNADSIREGVAGSEAGSGSESEAEEVVLIGGSYIGCEVAASLSMMGKRATIVMQERATLERGFGERAGGFAQGLLEEHGVRVYGQDELERFEAGDAQAGGAQAGAGRVGKVITRGGLELRADAVVVGAGVTPDVGLAQRAGLRIGQAGGIACDAGLRTPVPGVYAAGDVCEYESVVHGGERIRIEHWDVAFNHGKTAALNMLGQDVKHEVVPYFYSVLGDWGEFEYVGPAKEWDEEIVRGSMADGKDSEFTNWYLTGGRVVAALTWGRSDDLEDARRLLRAGVELSDEQKAALGDVNVDLGDVG